MLGFTDRNIVRPGGKTQQMRGDSPGSPVQPNLLYSVDPNCTFGKLLVCSDQTNSLTYDLSKNWTYWYYQQFPVWKLGRR